MKIFVIGLAALPFVVAGGPVKAADVLTSNPIVVAADDSMESTDNPPFSDVDPGDQPFDSNAGAPNDESNMQMEPSDQEEMGPGGSGDSSGDDSMDE